MTKSAITILFCVLWQLSVGQDVTPFNLRMFKVQVDEQNFVVLDTIGEVPTGGHVYEGEDYTVVQFSRNPIFTDMDVWYFATFDVMPNGEYQLLFPSPERGEDPEDFVLQPGQKQMVSDLVLEFGPPYGRESFVTIFSRVPVDYTKAIYPNRIRTRSLNANAITTTELEWILLGKPPERLKGSVLVDRFDFDIVPKDFIEDEGDAKEKLRGTIPNRLVYNAFPDLTLINPPEPSFQVDSSRGAGLRATKSTNASIVIKGQVSCKSELSNIWIAVRSLGTGDVKTYIYASFDSSLTSHYFEQQVALFMGKNDIDIRVNSSNGFTTKTAVQVDRRPNRLLMDTSAGRDFIVAIAANDYETWDDLKNPIHDAEQFIDIMTTSYGVSDEHVYTLYNQNWNNTAIDSLFRVLITNELTAKDRVIVYYAGHGYYDGMFDTGFWIPHNGARNIHNNASWLSNMTIAKYIQYLPTSHTLFIADACFSGSFFRIDNNFHGEQQFNKTPRSRWLISSGNMEYVADGYGTSNHSPFAYYLLEYLRDPKNETFTTSDVSKYLIETVSKVANQTPVAKPIKNAGDEGGLFRFKRTK